MIAIDCVRGILRDRDATFTNRNSMKKDRIGKRLCYRSLGNYSLEMAIINFAIVITREKFNCLLHKFFIIFTNDLPFLKYKFKKLKESREIR